MSDGYVFKDAALLIDGYDLSGDHSEIHLKVSSKLVSVPAFGYASIPRVCGMRDTEFSHVGYFKADSADFQIDDVISSLGTEGTIISVVPLGLTNGTTVYFFESTRSRYENGAPIGNSLNVNGAAVCKDRPVVRGTLLKTGALTGSDNGTAYQLGAVGATQKLYGVVHVVANTGSLDRSLTMKIQSCANENFAAGVTDRITFTDFTTDVGVFFATPVVGAIADTWWRASWTTIGTGESFTTHVSAGIL